MTRANIGPGPAIGRAAKALREQAQRSLRETARQTGIAASYLHKLEEGGVANPSIGVVMALADAVGSSVAELIGERPATNIRTAEVEVELRQALRRIGREAMAAANGPPHAALRAAGGGE